MTRYCMFTFCFLLLSAGFAYGSKDPAPASLHDLASLKQDSNPARLKALQKILGEKGIPYELQTFESPPTPHDRTQGVNLITTFGKGPCEITLGAHYDALELKEGGLIDGMVDNGAGTIVLVRVAEALKGRNLDHRVRIVFFDMEEAGMLGSRAYVAAHKSDIAAAINLDVIGFGDSIGYGLHKAAGTDRIQKALLMTCAEQLLFCMDSANYPPGDDRSFQEADIPVISLGSAPRLAMHQGWLLMNGGDNSGLEEGFMPQVFRIIHTPEDNLSKIEPATLDLAFRVVLNTVLKLDAALE